MVRIRSRYKKDDTIIGDEERGLLLRNGSFMWARNDEIRADALGGHGHAGSEIDRTDRHRVLFSLPYRVPVDHRPVICPRPKMPAAVLDAAGRSQPLQARVMETHGDW